MVEELVHAFVPKHEKVSDKEKVLSELGAKAQELPKINIKDPAIAHIEPKAGDIVEITRQSKTAGEIKFYRVVVDES